MPITRTTLYFRHYIYIFLIISISAFLIFGGIVYSKMSNINQDFKRAAASEAYMEVHNVVEDTISHFASLAADITTLNEIHQQLSNPGYYGYWKQHRASTLNLPGHVKNIDIYNSNKEILGRTANHDTEARITFTNGYFYINDTGLYYIQSFPILSRNNATDIDGYLLVKRIGPTLADPLSTRSRQLPQ